MGREFFRTENAVMVGLIRNFIHGAVRRAFV